MEQLVLVILLGHHGEPTVANAHPHVSSDQRFALVHNGVIENFEELKEQF